MILYRYLCFFDCYITEGTVQYINENFIQAVLLSERNFLKRFNNLDEYVRFNCRFTYKALNTDYEGDIKGIPYNSNPQYYTEQKADNTIKGVVIDSNNFVQRIKRLGIQ